jgi:hypothetical protein
MCALDGLVRISCINEEQNRLWARVFRVHGLLCGSKSGEVGKALGSDCLHGIVLWVYNAELSLESGEHCVGQMHWSG